MAGRPPVFETAEAMQAAIDLYFETNEIWTITGLALSLGFESRQSLYDYEEKEAFSYIVKKARLKVEHAYELRLCTASTPTGAIFALKNMGWADKVQTEQSGPNGGPIQTENKHVVEFHDMSNGDTPKV